MTSKRKVAIYARTAISQSEGLMNQIKDIENYISNKPDYELISTYLDNGLNGFQTRKPNTGLSQLVKDAKGGKFDLIITKTISRFSRNMETAIKTAWELKQAEVEVFFMNENISSFDDNFVTIYAIILRTQEKA